MFVVVGLNVSFDACTCDMFRALVKSSLAPAICLLAKITGLGRLFDLHGHALLCSHSSYKSEPAAATSSNPLTPSALAFECGCNLVDGVADMAVDCSDAGEIQLS